MPYRVFKRKDQYCVYTVDKEEGHPMGDSHGCHATSDEAHAQQRALYANAPDEKNLYLDETDYKAYPMEDDDGEDEKMTMTHADAMTPPERKKLYQQKRMEQEQDGKTLSLDQLREEIALDFSATFPRREDYDCWVREAFADHVIVYENGQTYHVAYRRSDDNEYFIFVDRPAWIPVREQRDWVIDQRPQPQEPLPDTEKSPNSTPYPLYKNNALKALHIDTDTMRVGNYLILFDGNDLEGLEYPYIAPKATNPDGTHGERFAKNVNIDSDYTKSGFIYVDFEHGHDPDKIGNHKDSILGYVDMKSLRRDQLGIYGERVLNRHHAYMKWLDTLIKAGVVGSSTEPVQTLVEKTVDGTITRWGLKRDTFTVTPMDYRMVSENVVTALKALNLYPEDPPPDNSSESVTEQVKGKSQPTQPTTKTKETKMDILQLIINSDASPEEKAQLIRDYQAKPAPVSVADQTPAPDDAQKAIDDAVAKALKAKGFGTRVETPAPNGNRPILEAGTATPADEPTPEQAYAKSVYIAKYGTEDAAKAAIMSDIAGKSYHQTLFDQDVAFARYCRLGLDALDSNQRKALKTQIFPVDEILRFVYEKGMSVEEMKATQVEAQGSLGGFAVPAQRQAEWIKRIRGLTVVRQAGAMVVVLANSNSAEFIEYTGGDTQYVGNIRGEWGAEGATPNVKNMTLGMVSVTAHTYTYRVKMSQDIVEDAANLISVLEADIVDTLAIDEDNAFLTGDGTMKPRGILPGGANTFALTEVNSADANVLTADGLKLLKRGVASQYRQGAVFVANSDTWGAIEVMRDDQGGAGTGLYLFPDLSETDRLLNRKVYESEAMPDVAANAFPIIFGNMRGYGIVERLGLSIERFHDSNTGANQTWFDVRRRVGGRPLYPWMFAIQKVAA